MYKLARGTYIRKLHTIPYTFCALGGHIPSVPANVLYMIPLLAYVKPPSYYTLL